MGPPDYILVLGVKYDRIAFTFCHILDLVHNLADYLCGVWNQSLLLLQLFILLFCELLQIILEGCYLLIYLFSGVAEVAFGLNFSLLFLQCRNLFFNRGLS